jgi:uncharacterized protein (DUF2384 family)
MAITRKPSKKVLPIDESDRRLRVIMALDRATDVLGSQDSGRRWLWELAPVLLPRPTNETQSL